MYHPKIHRFYRQFVKISSHFFQSLSYPNLSFPDLADPSPDFTSSSPDLSRSGPSSDLVSSFPGPDLVSSGPDLVPYPALALNPDLKRSF